MSNDEARELILKYRSGDCTEKEQAMLESWYNKLSAQGKIEISAPELEAILAEIWAGLPVNDMNQTANVVQIDQQTMTGRSILLWMRYAAAVVIVIGLAGLGRWIFTEKTPASDVASNNKAILPGGNNAVLTLSDQSQVNLSARHSGVITRQGNMIIQKISSGTIAYQVTNADDTASNNRFNTIETPAGGQFQAVLPDGTRVWLNAASKITYPVSFNHLKERRIKLTGEAYFEVRHDAKKPFFVETSMQITEDIGTAFNINNYSDEGEINTTLLEGSVRVTPVLQDTGRRGYVEKGRVLKRGQQATVRSGSIKVRSVDPEQALDWKNEEFVFDHQSIKEIMRKIARWYNVKVVYEKNTDLTQTFGGQVPRSTPIRQVLKGLEATGNIKFRINGRTITVSSPGKK